MRRRVLALVVPSVLDVLAVLALLSTRVEAQTVQLSPFGSFEFGGSLSSPVFESVFSLGSSLGYGGSVDVAVAKGWAARHGPSASSSWGPRGWFPTSVGASGSGLFQGDLGAGLIIAF